MLAEKVDCAWPGFKKRIWLSEKQLCLAKVKSAFEINNIKKEM
jgi:hypothetical protein